jgi:hypothetical protein
MWFLIKKKKVMLYYTHEEKKQVPENYNNDHEVQVELDTHIKEETIENSRSFISGD